MKIGDRSATQTEAATASTKIAVVDPRATSSDGEASAELSGSESKGGRMSDWRAQAERAGHTVAFLDADVTVNCKRPDFLLMSPSVAEMFALEHPEAKRLSLAELEIFIERKYGDHDGQQT